MNKKELSKALKIAKSDTDLFNEDIDIFYGFGLSDYTWPVYVTIEQVARLIRYQAQQMNGYYNSEAIQEIANLGRKRFQIIG